MPDVVLWFCIRLHHYVGDGSEQPGSDAAERHARSPPTPAHVASTPLNHAEGRRGMSVSWRKEGGGGFHILLFQPPNAPMTDAVGSLRSSG